MVVEWLRQHPGFRVEKATSDHIVVYVVEGKNDTGFFPEFWRRVRGAGYQPETVNTVAEYAELEPTGGAHGLGFGGGL